MTDLEARFEQEMVEKVYRAAGRETGYWAGYFLRSVKRHGGSGAARRLLQQRSVSRGLAKLAALGRLDRPGRPRFPFLARREYVRWEPRAGARDRGEDAPGFRPHGERRRRPWPFPS